MDNIPEREQPNPERIIRLGEQFQPFNPKYTTTYSESIPFYSSITLNVQENIKIPFILRTPTANPSKKHAITPFDPELGYQIDYDDLRLETRLQKLQRLREDLEKPINSQKASIYLDINANLFTPNEADTNSLKDYSNPRFAQENNFIKNLRLYVFFPNGQFESRPWEPYLDSGGIWFKEYYPLDTGQLPDVGHSDIDEGFGLYLPSDPQKLSQIKARFVLAEEQPEESQT